MFLHLGLNLSEFGAVLFLGCDLQVWHGWRDALVKVIPLRHNGLRQHDISIGCL